MRLTPEDLLHAIGGVDDDLIPRPVPPASIHRRKTWMGWLAAAACLALAVTVSLPYLAGGGSELEGSASADEAPALEQSAGGADTDAIQEGGTDTDGSPAEDLGAESVTPADPKPESGTVREESSSPPQEDSEAKTEDRGDEVDADAVCHHVLIGTVTAMDPKNRRICIRTEEGTVTELTLPERYEIDQPEALTVNSRVSVTWWGEGSEPRRIPEEQIIDFSVLSDIDDH